MQENQIVHRTSGLRSKRPSLQEVYDRHSSRTKNYDLREPKKERSKVETLDRDLKEAEEAGLKSIEEELTRTREQLQAKAEPIRSEMEKHALVAHEVMEVSLPVD